MVATSMVAVVLSPMTFVMVVAMALVMMVVITSPMVAVAHIMALTDNLLVVAATEAFIFFPPLFIVLPWIPFVNYGFVAMVLVIIAVSWGQITTMYPNIIFTVYVLMSRYIIVSINIGHVIILRVGVPNRAPFGLAADVYAGPYNELRISSFK